MNCNPPGSSVHGIFQAETLEWIHFLLLGFFLTQGSNPGLQFGRQILGKPLLYCMPVIYVIMYISFTSIKKKKKCSSIHAACHSIPTHTNMHTLDIHARHQTQNPTVLLRHTAPYTHTPSGSCTTPLVNEALYRQMHNAHTHTHTHNLGHKTQNFRHRNSSPHLNIQPHTSLWVGTSTQNLVSHTITTTTYHTNSDPVAPQRWPTSQSQSGPSGLQE